MARLKLLGWRVEGVEWNTFAAARARQNTGLPVATGDFRDVPLEAAFDLIALDHVVEHIARPDEVLRRAWELLAPGGRCVLLYPNPCSIGAHWFGADWYHWDPPRHLALPRAAALRALARTAGFSSVRVRYRTDYTEEQWIRSKAIRLSLNPDAARPTLSPLERLVIAGEALLNALSFPVGWETVAVLKK